MRTFLAAALAAAVISAAATADEKDKEVEKLLKDIEDAAKAKDYDKMIKLAGMAPEAEKNNPAINFALGTAHAAKREHGKSVEAFEKVVEHAKDVPIALDRLGDAYLKNGQFDKAVKSFDEYLKKVKKEDRDLVSKNHWRRGIALYYDGQYDKGAEQFKIHHEVNKEDVENSVWNYACILRAGLAAGKKPEDVKPMAAKGLFEAKSDGREPLQAVLEMFKDINNNQFKKVVDAIDKYKKDGKGSAEDKKEAEFYGRLYIALYYDAEKKYDDCKTHLLLAVGEKDKDERKNKAITHYMWDVAVAHLDHFEELKKRK